jgi:pimeloyl-ACP methyl ester carboxylesterase
MAGSSVFAVVAVVAVLLALHLWPAICECVSRPLLYPGAAGVHAPAPSQGSQIMVGDGICVLVAGRLDAGADTPVVLYSRGNAEAADADAMQRVAARLGAVVTWDYPGYGRSLHAGKPSEASVLRGADAVADFVRQQGVADDRLLLVGRSLGSGPAVHLAATRPTVRGLLLMAAFTSVVDVAFPGRRGRGLLGWDVYRNEATIGRVACPVTIFHGALDNVVPVEHGQRLAAACAACTQARVRVLEGAGHNDLNLLTCLQAVLSVSAETGRERGTS